MSLSITSVVRENGAGCDHLTVTVDHEGVSRQFKTSFGDIDALIASLGGVIPATKTLVMLWAAYRRAESRSVVSVTIA